tara:strand:- start:178 stop:429 length:252 start_codon:yes stop_codon:yes gene_type:complete
MKNSSGKRRFIKNCIGDFIFRENLQLGLSSAGTFIPSKNLKFQKLNGKFIKINLENKTTGGSSKILIFKCVYKMMRRINHSLN